MERSGIQCGPAPIHLASPPLPSTGGDAGHTGTRLSSRGTLRQAEHNAKPKLKATNLRARDATGKPVQKAAGLHRLIGRNSHLEGYRADDEDRKTPTGLEAARYCLGNVEKKLSNQIPAGKSKEVPSYLRAQATGAIGGGQLSRGQPGRAGFCGAGSRRVSVASHAVCLAPSALQHWPREPPSTSSARTQAGRAASAWTMTHTPSTACWRHEVLLRSDVSLLLTSEGRKPISWLCLSPSGRSV